jgi:hypothetical protein
VVLYVVVVGRVVVTTGDDKENGSGVDTNAGDEYFGLYVLSVDDNGLSEIEFISFLSPLNNFDDSFDGIRFVFVLFWKKISQK